MIWETRRLFTRLCKINKKATNTKVTAKWNNSYKRKETGKILLISVSLFCFNLVWTFGLQGKVGSGLGKLGDFLDSAGLMDWGIAENGNGAAFKGFSLCVSLCCVYFSRLEFSFEFWCIWGCVSWFFADSSRPTGLANKWLLNLVRLALIRWLFLEFVAVSWILSHPLYLSWFGYTNLIIDLLPAFMCLKHASIPIITQLRRWLWFLSCRSRPWCLIKLGPSLVEFLKWWGCFCWETQLCSLWRRSWRWLALQKPAASIL